MNKLNMVNLGFSYNETTYNSKITCECYAYGIELAVTDGEGGKGFGIDTIEFAQTKEEDLESSSHIEIIELHYFNELEEAKKCFKKYCEWYAISE
jgi:hypothetical protein